MHTNIFYFFAANNSVLLCTLVYNNTVCTTTVWHCPPCTTVTFETTIGGEKKQIFWRGSQNSLRNCGYASVTVHKNVLIPHTHKKLKKNFWGGAQSHTNPPLLGNATNFSWKGTQNWHRNYGYATVKSTQNVLIPYKILKNSEEQAQTPPQTWSLLGRVNEFFLESGHNWLSNYMDRLLPKVHNNVLKPHTKTLVFCLYFTFAQNTAPSPDMTNAGEECTSSLGA